LLAGTLESPQQSEGGERGSDQDKRDIAAPQRSEKPPKIAPDGIHARKPTGAL